MACEGSLVIANNVSPVPPPIPSCPESSKRPAANASSTRGYNSVSMSGTDLWERLFNESYRADVAIHTSNGGIIYSHANILGMVSPVLKSILTKSRRVGRHRPISIRGVPHEAVRAFVRYLYSCSYDPDEMEDFVLHLLVLSHAYAVPHLKRACEWHLERRMLTIENVVDVIQLALLCDAPRLGLICHRLILKNFTAVCMTGGWRDMKNSHPMLEKGLLQSVVKEGTRQEERTRKLNERKMYLQLYEAMEALVHICRDGCRTIGPHDKALKEDQDPCNYSSCKQIELLVRHFASCKMRVQGGCIHCNRMWQLLELHSHLCADSDVCKVPLCSNFKEKRMTKEKKDDIKWRILVRKILRSKSISGAPFFSLDSP
ncbi:BTB/POZ and TAZ domain-containing protein 4 [Diospyros lotus]|uniref:BTB/POZ and TAZ domain-containing protein 4 n=1 Tax=Diospyros lotus TaxID=55363 RepID=UPI002253438F|nr:BTB/POZ and TAZ domain-containing protein 4 [Diospyros lotus]